MFNLDPITRKDLFTRDVILQHLAHIGELRAPNLNHRCSREHCFPRNYLQLGIQPANPMQQFEESIFVCRECKVHKCNELCEGVLMGTRKSDYFCPISRKTKGHERLEIDVEGRDQVASFGDKNSGKQNTMTRVLELSNDVRLSGEKLDAYYSKYELPRIKPRTITPVALTATQVAKKSKVENVIITRSRKGMEDAVTKHASRIRGLLEIFSGHRRIKVTQMGIPIFLHLPDCREYIANHLFRKRRDGRRVPSTTLLVSADKFLLSNCLPKYAERIETIKRENGGISKRNNTAAGWREDRANFEKNILAIKKIEDIFRFYFPSLSRWKSSLVTLQSQQFQKYATMINTLRNCQAERAIPNLFEISHDLDLSTVWRSETLIDFPTHTMYTRYFRIVYTMLQFCLSTYDIIARKKTTAETVFKSVTVDKLVFGILEILQTGMRNSDGLTVIPKDFYLNRKGITPEKNKLVMFSKNTRKTESRGIVVVTKCLEYGLRTMTPAQLWNHVSGRN